MLGDIGHTVKIEEVEERFGDVRGVCIIIIIILVGNCNQV